MLIWVPEKPDGDVHSIDISMDGDDPWRRLSWNYQHGQIPVPTLKGMYSESVRGIYEGLKLVGKIGSRGKINVGYFAGAGRARPVQEGDWMRGWDVGGLPCSAVGANDMILIPAYTWMIQNKAHAVVARMKSIIAKLDEEDQHLYVYDEVKNGERMEHEVLSPAAILTMHLGYHSPEQTYQ